MEELVREGIATIQKRKSLQSKCELCKNIRACNVAMFLQFSEPWKLNHNDNEIGDEGE